MRRILLLVVFVLLGGCDLAQADNDSWLFGVGGIADAHLVVSESGCTFVVGYFDTMMITIGSRTITKSGTRDLILFKVSPTGEILWVKDCPSDINLNQLNIAIDSSSNIYLAGSYVFLRIDSTTFVSDEGPEPCSPAATFITKLDSSGNLIWAKSTNGGGCQNGWSLAANKSGRLLLNVAVNGTLILDSIKIQSQNNGVAVLAVLSIDKNGHIMWAQTAEISSGQCMVGGCTIDESSNCVVCGQFQGPSMSFGSRLLSYMPVSWGAFIAKYDSVGALIWATGGGNGTGDSFLTSVALDQSENVFVAGVYAGSGFSLGNVSLPNLGSWRLLVLKLDPNGAAIWGKSGETLGDESSAFSLAIDRSQNVNVVGYFYTDRDTSSGKQYTFDTKIVKSRSERDGLFVQLSNSGNTNFADVIGGKGSDDIRGIAFDPTGCPIICGFFKSDTLEAFGDTLKTGASCTSSLARFHRRQNWSFPTLCLLGRGQSWIFLF